MNKLGFIRQFEHLECCDVVGSKTGLHDMYASEWSQKILITPKLRTYVTFKNSYAVEKYVLINLNRHERSILSQCRCGILPLRIETGRYIGEKPEERVCKICKNGQTEDEVHFLFNCEQYRNLRNDLAIKAPQYFYTDRSKAVLLLWFLTVLAVCVYTLIQLLC